MTQEGKGGSRCGKEWRGSHLSPGHRDPMECGRTAEIRRTRSRRPGGTTGDVCGSPGDSRYDM